MSKLKLTTIANQGDTLEVPSETVIAGSAKAWVHFNGTGTVAIGDSFNVSSITDEAAGIYTVNMTNAMPSLNYVVSLSSSNTGGVATSCLEDETDARTTSSFRFGSVRIDTTAGLDCNLENAVVFAN